MMDIAIEAERLLKGYAPITVSVNTSASQLRVGRFVSRLPKLLAETGFPASHLEIEITESSFIEREDEVTPFLKDLKEMGINIAIDDFGTGYSSLSYLRDMPLNCIKIDRSFIVNIPDDTKQCDLTSAIIKLAKIMSFKVIAEGVETREQLDFLTNEGAISFRAITFPDRFRRRNWFRCWSGPVASEDARNLPQAVPQFSLARPSAVTPTTAKSSRAA